MIAEVIPYTRTIRGKDFFDYKIPHDLDIKVGSTVIINFRNKEIIGIVKKIKNYSSAQKLKPILGLSNFQLSNPKIKLALISWFAKYYYISKAHAFKTIQSPVLSQIKKKQNLSPVNNNFLSTIKVSKQQIDLIQKINNKIQKKKQNLIHYNNRALCLLLYRKIIKKNKRNILIIVPEYHNIQKIIGFLDANQNIITWEKDPSPSEIILLEKKLLEKNSNYTVIGTKKMIFLSPLFETIIIDQEEAKSHKQYHLNPRYTVSTVVQKIYELCSKNNNNVPTIIYTSHAPSLNIYYQTQKKKVHYLDMRLPSKKQNLILIDMEDEKKKKNFSWFSEELIQGVINSKKSFLFLNRTGKFNLSICQDCSKILNANEIKCQFCNSTNIKQTTKGITQLESELNSIFDTKQILRIDSTQNISKLSKKQINNADIIIGTEKVMRLIELSSFDFIGILSIDHLLIYPHFKSQERVFQILAEIFSYNVTTILQTHAPDNSTIKNAILGNYEVFAKQELSVRKLLKLPPFYDYINLINTKTKKVDKLKGELKNVQLIKDTVIDKQ